MTIIINLKNYPEVLGRGSLRIAEAAQRASLKTGAQVIVAPPGPMVALVASMVAIPVFSQTVGNETGDKTTGAFLPEAVRAAGAKGTLLNHSESSRPLSELKRLVPSLKGLPLAVCLCAGTTPQAVILARLEPDYLAVEPPETDRLWHCRIKGKARTCEPNRLEGEGDRIQGQDPLRGRNRQRRRCEEGGRVGS